MSDVGNIPSPAVRRRPREIDLTSFSDEQLELLQTQAGPIRQQAREELQRRAADD